MLTAHHDGGFEIVNSDGQALAYVSATLIRAMLKSPRRWFLG